MSQPDTTQWRDMMSYLRNHHGTICRQWFEELEPVRMDAGLLEIQTSTGVQQNYLQKRCLDPFIEAAQAVTGNLVGVRFVSEPTTPKPNGQANPATILRQSTTRPADDEQMVLSPDYSFENFITGPNNRLAVAAAQAVAEQPGEAYNPLFIHGGVGLGKTHLLQAICQEILNTKPDTTILYVSCDAFMNQFIECVRGGNMSDFRHRYRHVDVLVIDDIHFLNNKDRSQEELFHTFNELYQNNKQIVLSSDAAPNEIPQLEERLVSRFNWGLVAHVDPPCFETRAAILKAKAQMRGMEVPADVIDYIAQRIDTNARDLEGAVLKLQGNAAIDKRPIDMDLARKALGEAAAPRTNQVTLQHIIDAVTVFYNVKLSDLQSRRRHKSVTEPRQVCMWLARKHTRFSLEEIGGYFGGRDHTTVMHSIKTVKQRGENDPQYASQVRQLDDQIARQ